MTPTSWVHEWWLQDDCLANKDEGQQVCRKIAEIDALWRMSNGEKTGVEGLEQIDSIEDAFSATVQPEHQFRGCGIVIPRP